MTEIKPEDPFERLERYTEEARTLLYDSEEGSEDYWYYNGQLVAFEQSLEVLGDL